MRPVAEVTAQTVNNGKQIRRANYSQWRLAKIGPKSKSEIAPCPLRRGRLAGQMAEAESALACRLTPAIA